MIVASEKQSVCHLPNKRKSVVSFPSRLSDDGIRHRVKPGGAEVCSPEETVDTGGNKFTWQEVAKHNTPQSAWVIVTDKVYDITSECAS